MGLPFYDEECVRVPSMSTAIFLCVCVCVKRFTVVCFSEEDIINVRLLNGIKANICIRPVNKTHIVSMWLGLRSQGTRTMSVCVWWF